MRKICFVTGTRAEYGLLSRLMRLVADSPDCRLQVIATNMHLLPEYGLTYREIERDGFTIDCKVWMHKPTDDAAGVVDSMSSEMLGINEAFASLQPDLVVILGDRYEMLVAATVAMMLRIPIAHIHGGEITQGAVDDSIRHSITKMASLHFASTEAYRHRIIQLGEDPGRVFCVGSPGVENIKEIPLLSRGELERELGLDLSTPPLLCTYHPVTLGHRTADELIADFLAALDFFPEQPVVFTYPNSDQGGDSIARAIKQYCARHPERCHGFESVGLRRYLSLMHYAAAVAGNSSSGIIESPSAGIPTLNIGDRQKGRAHAVSVVDCADDTASIVDGLRKVLSPEFRAVAAACDNPYDKPGTALAIFDIISTYPLDSLSQKTFFDIEF